MFEKVINHYQCIVCGCNWVNMGNWVFNDYCPKCPDAAAIESIKHYTFKESNTMVLVASGSEKHSWMRDFIDDNFKRRGQVVLRE